jgi:hypothetical protein
MKKLMLPLFAALLFAACQNSTTTPAADTQNLPAELKIDPAQVKEANVKAKTSLQKMTTMMEEITNDKTSFSPAQKTEVDAIRSQLNDVIQKQEMMSKGLEAANNGGGGEGSSLSGSAVPPPGVLQDYIQSTSNYDKFLEELQAKYEAVKSGKSKGN